MKYKSLILSLCFILLPIWQAFPDEVYFSPQGGVQEKIVEELKAAKRTVDVMMYGLTSDVLSQSIVKAHKRGVKVRVLLDKVQSRGNESKSDYLIDHGIEVRIEHQKGIMHNKVAIIDDSTVITGSYNWTSNAELMNQENMLVIDTPEIVQKYQERFQYLWELNAED